MIAVIKESLTGIYSGINNADYHASEGISKSGLDLISKSPAAYAWSLKAPEDRSKTKALDFGTAFHCLVLEPEEFHKRYVVAPIFNLRSNAGKEEKANFEIANKDKEVLSADDALKLDLMRDSLHAHPTASSLMNLNGVAEQSVYWIDPDTGIQCRCRPDWLVQKENLIVDLKTTADLDRIQRSVEDYRYYVQDAFYRAGLKNVTGEDYDFLFLFVSSSVNCGKYPVDVIRLSDAARFDGEQHYKRDLNTYADCFKSGDWQSITELDRPHWAIQQEGEIT